MPAASREQFSGSVFEQNTARCKILDRCLEKQDEPGEFLPLVGNPLVVGVYFPATFWKLTCICPDTEHEWSFCYVGGIKWETKRAP